MIIETIVTTLDGEGRTHIAPMGIHREEGQWIILPFKPSRTLDILRETSHCVINYCDDVRIFAGCLTGRREWPLLPAEQITGTYLASALAHDEMEVVDWVDDELRPQIYCRPVHSKTHQSFKGFNRAQFAVLEAAILYSRVSRLPWDKIESELNYLTIGFEKTAGPIEKEAWGWLMDAFAEAKQGIYD